MKRQLGGRGFTIVDLLVSIGVITVLLALLMPALSTARRTAKRVVCASNIKQLGTQLIAWSHDHDDEIPPTIQADYDPRTRMRLPRFDRMMRVYVEAGDERFASSGTIWDGLGLLYSAEYIPDPGVYYCPSHTGEHTEDRYAAAWGMGGHQQIATNVHYRAIGPNGSRQLTRIDPRTTALITDGMETQQDFNHQIGTNVFRADHSVHWVTDADEVILSSLPLESSPQATINAINSAMIRTAWEIIDEFVTTGVSRSHRGNEG